MHHYLDTRKIKHHCNADSGPVPRVWGAVNLGRALNHPGLCLLAYKVRGEGTGRTVRPLALMFPLI